LSSELLPPFLLLLPLPFYVEALSLSLRSMMLRLSQGALSTPLYASQQHLDGIEVETDDDSHPSTT